MDGRGTPCRAAPVFSRTACTGRRRCAPARHRPPQILGGTPHPARVVWAGRSVRTPRHDALAAGGRIMRLGTAATRFAAVGRGTIRDRLPFAPGGRHDDPRRPAAVLAFKADLGPAGVPHGIGQGDSGRVPPAVRGAMRHAAGAAPAARCIALVWPGRPRDLGPTQRDATREDTMQPGPVSLRTAVGLRRPMLSTLCKVAISC